MTNKNIIIPTDIILNLKERFKVFEIILALNRCAIGKNGILVFSVDGDPGEVIFYVNPSYGPVVPEMIEYEYMKDGLRLDRWLIDGKVAATWSTLQRIKVLRAGNG